jgi:hypothetical protein
MKPISIIFGTALLILFGCTAPQETAPVNPLEGAWQVVSWQFFSGDTLQMELGKGITGNEMKIWSSGHYSYAGSYQMDTTFMNNFGAGRYELDGTHYVETLEYVQNQSNVGNTVRLLLEIQGDTVIQTWPADENWEITAEQYYIQKLTRLE